jgi:hypothetical protein
LVSLPWHWRAVFGPAPLKSNFQQGITLGASMAERCGSAYCAVHCCGAKRPRTVASQSSAAASGRLGGADVHGRLAFPVRPAAISLGLAWLALAWLGLAWLALGSSFVCKPFRCAPVDRRAHRG